MKTRIYAAPAVKGLKTDNSHGYCLGLIHQHTKYIIMIMGMPFATPIFNCIRNQNKELAKQIEKIHGQGNTIMNNCEKCRLSPPAITS